MTSHFRSVVVACVLSLWAMGCGSVLAAAGPGGGPPGGGNPPDNSASGPGAGRFANPGMSGSEFDSPVDAKRVPGRDWPQPGDRSSLPGAPPDFPGRSGSTVKTVPLNNVVSMVQQRFNATAVKTDAVRSSGQLIYRIRLLSADKSRVWTVDVDARTGLIN